MADRLYAFGSVPGANGERAPAAWSSADARRWSRLALTPATGYGKKAEFVMAGLAGGHVSAYGQAFGGAHGSARPTTWVGSANRLREYEQSFILFGGEDAISVSTETARAGTVLLAGQWDTGRYGAAVWLSPNGVDWTRHTDVAQLSSGPGEQTSAHGATTSGRQFVLTGDTQRTDRIEPLAWTSPDGLTWRRIALPSAVSASATRAACSGGRCVVIGSTFAARSRLACWTLSARTGAARTGARAPGGGLVQVSQVLLRARDAVTVQRIDGRVRLYSVGQDCRGWRSMPTPVASRDAVLGTVGRRLVLATTGSGASRLWVR